MKVLKNKPVSPTSALPFTWEHLRDALGNNALEGLHPSPADLEDLEKVAVGELSGPACLNRIRNRYGVSV